MQHRGVESTGFLRGALLNQVLLLHGKLFLCVRRGKDQSQSKLQGEGGDRLSILRIAKLDSVVKV